MQTNSTMLLPAKIILVIARLRVKIRLLICDLFVNFKMESNYMPTRIFMNPYSSAKSVSRLLFLIVFFISGLQLRAAYSISPLNDPNFCVNVYPTGYVTVNFSISEVTNNGNFGFRKSQNNRTLILSFSNSNFNFNPGVGTITASGSEITINSFAITSTSITLNISVSNSNRELNTISFSNLQVRATGAGVAILRRSGGTLSIDNSTGTPGSGISWGTLTAGTPFFYGSNLTQQVSVSDVYVGTNINQILLVQVTIGGTCGSAINATSFTFNTAGTGLATQNASVNIANAQLYYTSTSTVFATSNLFGSVSNPNGIFVINGNQSFSVSGTYNFWLTYNISANAINNDLVDAQFVSANIAGNSVAASSGNPAGSRKINNQVYYTRNNNVWNDISSKWSVTLNGPACACVPASGSAVFINHPTQLNVNSPALGMITINTGGALTDAVNVLTVSDIGQINGTGFFQASAPWTIGSLKINGTGVSGTSEALIVTGDLEIESGATLQMNGASGKDLTVNGNVTINGLLSLGIVNSTHTNSAGPSFAGTGTITGSGNINMLVARTSPVGTNLTIGANIVIGSNVTITNYGTITMLGSIIGSSTNSRWVNEINSVLNMSGTNSALLATGVLDASYVPNVVNYSGASAQSIKIPLNGYYHHLYMSTSGAKSISAAIEINGDIIISGTAQFATGANFITVRGNWINNSAHMTPFLSSSIVYFNGTNTTISGTGVTNFNEVNILSGSLLTGHATPNLVLVSGNWVNDGDFQHNNGEITFSGTSLITGISPTIFYDLKVNNGQSLTFHSVSTGIVRNLTVGSAAVVNHNNGTVSFVGSATTQSVIATSLLTFYALEVDNPLGYVRLGAPVLVNNSLILSDGVIATSTANILGIAAGASASSGTTTSFVEGPMEKTGNTAFVFPVGKGNRWARIGLGNLTSSSTFRAEYFNTPYSNTSSMATSPTPTLNNVSKIEYWQLDRMIGTGTGNVTLHWNDASFSAINDCSTSDLRVARFNGTAWVNVSEGVTTTGACTGQSAGSVSTSTSTTAFSPFTFGSKSPAVNFLPLEVISFTSQCANGNIELGWKTALEIHAQYFIIQARDNKDNWHEIAKVDATGSYYSGALYTVTDSTATTPENKYYRLIQVDKDDSRNYSKIIHQECEAKAGNTMNLFPNPCQGSASAWLYHPHNNEQGVLQIKDALGNTVREIEIQLTKGRNEFRFDHLNTKGFYFINVILRDNFLYSVGKLIVN